MLFQKMMVSKDFAQRIILVDGNLDEMDIIKGWQCNETNQNIFIKYLFINYLSILKT